MKRTLIAYLVVPLLAATAVALFIGARWSADGFFVNLAAGFVGNLITVFYVDWILQRHEQSRWSVADARISGLLRRLSAATITGIRTSFGYGTEIFDTRALNSGSPSVMQVEVLRVATHVLAPVAEAKITDLDTAGWKRLCAHLQQISAECGSLIDRFGHRLQPRALTILLDLQQGLDSAQAFWRVFPDIAGVPEAQLPRTKTPPKELQTAWCGLTARDIRRVLELAVQLSQTTGDA